MTIRPRLLAATGYLFALVLLVVVAAPSAHAQLTSRITSGAHNPVVPGDIVWADLVTTDVATAVAFYTAVFGWERRTSGDPNYVELALNGKLVCAIAGFDDDDVAAGSARWLVSVSVADVDNTAGRFVESGGRILEAPYDLPDRGRLAVVADDQGAMLILLRATGGDPPRGKAAPGTWAWAELWTRDVEKAVAFYEQVIGYRAVRDEGDDGQPPVVLTTGEEPQAIIVQIPWEYVEPNWLPYVLVADGRKTLEDILDAGGSVLFTSDDVAEDSGTFAAIVSDPAGAVFAIQEQGTGQ